MEEAYEAGVNWLVREPLDDHSSIFSSPETTKFAISARESFIDELNSAILTCDRSCGVSLPERSSVSKMDSKYTLRVKICGNVLSDDGYKWRKYGQKSIKNSSNPRSYYRCTNPRCSAKKQVERSSEDPETLVVTYEGLHLHYTSHFLLPRPLPQDYNFTAAAKRLKVEPAVLQTDAVAPADCIGTETAAKRPPSTSTLPPAAHEPRLEAGEEARGAGRGSEAASSAGSILPGLCEDGAEGSQGLLEDVVPLLVRKPISSAAAAAAAAAASSDENNNRSSQSPPSSSTLSWSPISAYNYFDLGILSRICE